VCHYTSIRNQNQIRNPGEESHEDDGKSKSRIGLPGGDEGKTQEKFLQTYKGKGCVMTTSGKTKASNCTQMKEEFVLFS